MEGRKYGKVQQTYGIMNGDSSKMFFFWSSFSEILYSRRNNNNSFIKNNKNKNSKHVYILCFANSNFFIIVKSPFF